MTEVVILDDGLEAAIRRLRKKIIPILGELRRRESFRSKPQKRKDKQRASIRRRKKVVRRLERIRQGQTKGRGR